MDTEKLSNENELRVREFLESHELIATKIDSKQSIVEKPDYGVEGKNGFYFFCEVKSLFSDSNEKQAHSTYLNKFQRKIIKANEQFETVNKHHFVPNVLCFLSDDFRIDYRALGNYLKGEIDLISEIVDVQKYRDGNAFSSVRNIDLYVWLYEDLSPHYFFNLRDERFVYKFQTIFSISNIDEIMRI